MAKGRITRGKGRGNRVTVKLKGAKQVLQNLNRQISRIEGRSMQGLILAAAYIRRDMDKTPPLIPVDKGNLRGSWTVVTQKRRIIMGFTAIYAAAVHFNEGPVNWKRPNSGPYFFLNALTRNREEILRIISNTAKV